MFIDDGVSSLGEQRIEELRWMLDKTAGCSSVLEIGSRAGHTLRALATHCKPDAKVCSIDIEDGGVSEIVNELNAKGFQAEALFANSNSPAAVIWAKDRAPFDFIFIDGDHEYEGVRADWNNYRGMAKWAVGFHDIGHHTLGVRQLWNEIKGTGYYYTTEYASSDDATAMGIGIVLMNANESW